MGAKVFREPTGGEDRGDCAWAGEATAGDRSGVPRSAGAGAWRYSVNERVRTLRIFFGRCSGGHADGRDGSGPAAMDDRAVAVGTGERALAVALLCDEERGARCARGV